MLSIADITFHANHEYADTDDLISSQRSALLYVDAIREQAKIDVIKHVTSRETVIRNSSNFHFFIGKNSKGYLSKHTIRHLLNVKPDIIFVRGLIFPLQVLRLKMLLGKEIKIVAWHHADRPFHFPKRIVQQWADKCIDAYLFSSYGNAQEWLHARVIGDHTKVHEIPATLTAFTQQDKKLAKLKTGMLFDNNYLWVGRLDNNKDPLTILAAFEKLLNIVPSSKLYMVYQSGDLIEMVKTKVEENDLLKNAVILQGQVPNNELETWYSAADFYISGSHREGGSVALLEAMACGCIPVVTEIPSAMKTIDNGQYGFYFKPGDPDDLLIALTEATQVDKNEFSQKVRLHFEQAFSVKAVTRKLLALCYWLDAK